MRRSTVSILVMILAAAPALADQPVLTVTGQPAFGSWTFTGAGDPDVVIAYEADDPAGIGFAWSGDASAYGGAIDGYRWGWDVADPDDPNDPGWSGGGFGPDLFTAQRVFSSGLHSFTVVARDTAGNTTRATLYVDVQVVVQVLPRNWGALKAVYR